MHVFDWFYGLNFLVLYPLTIMVIISAAEIGIYFGRRRPSESEFGTPTGAALGLLALLLAFSVSLAVGRFEERRRLVLEEAEAISSTANFALSAPTVPGHHPQPLTRLHHGANRSRHTV